MTLAGRRVVLGVTGGIAAYKAVEVCRRLVDAGAHVAPVLTEGATHFVGETTFSALASEPVQTSLWHERSPIPHTRLGQSADVIVVAPATARLLSAYASGYSDDLLTATLLATRAPVVVCPSHAHRDVGAPGGAGQPRHPALAGSDGGPAGGGPPGRRATSVPAAWPSRPTSWPRSKLRSPLLASPVLVPTTRDLADVRVLVTAGGTREAIDAVRVITNRSSGKQGYAIATEAAARGARVTLVTTVDRPGPPGAEVVEVVSAADMQAAVVPRAEDHDVIVMAAAVADFRPVVVATRKLKKAELAADGPPCILLEPTHDFLVDLGQAKRPGQVLVGFAAETDDVLVNARKKLMAKHLDLIVANDVGAPGVGFEHDTNAVVLVTADGVDQDVPLTDKRTVARAVLDAVVALRTT